MCIQCFYWAFIMSYLRNPQDRWVLYRRENFLYSPLIFAGVLRFCRGSKVPFAVSNNHFSEIVLAVIVKAAPAKSTTLCGVVRTSKSG